MCIQETHRQVYVYRKGRWALCVCMLVRGRVLVLKVSENSLLRVVSLSIGGLSHMLTHSLPRCLSRTHALDITLPPSRNHLQLFSLTFITSTLPLANIHTHNPHRPFLYTWTCLRVSCTHIIFTPVSHALSHTSLPNRRV